MDQEEPIKKLAAEHKLGEIEVPEYVVSVWNGKEGMIHESLQL